MINLNFKIFLIVIVFFQTYSINGFESVDDIIKNIQVLEQDKDPKCYATASRLENFMFGTPLSSKARFSKNLLNKQWVGTLWVEASELAKKRKQVSISPKTINTILTKTLSYSQNKNSHYSVKFNSGRIIKINSNDKRQYSNVAYSLRTILAVQQESILDIDSNLLPLEQDALQSLKDHLDLLNLSILKISDLQARKNNLYEIDEDSLQIVWQTIAAEQENKYKTVTKSKNNSSNTDLTIVRKIIQQKRQSYKTYNNISNQLFVRNLQVYFARLSWPRDKQEGENFRKLFIETMIQFANDIYKRTEAIALKNDHHMILEGDVDELMQKFVPHHINEYEDAIFFPKLPPEQRITIESYDMDSFRDSGSHWLYLEYAINNPSFQASLQPDPFALELMVENIAQFGVLSLRVAGIVGKSKGAERLKQSYYINGLKLIQERINLHADVQVNTQQQQIVSSAPFATIKSSNNKKFTDITKQIGISAMHRSSDWLNRLLRSYLDKSKGVGIITIPPAFGGSGIAAEDINNDGYTDLLILSGLGNKLYLNKSGKSFIDITQAAGLEWKREQDNAPGEPRQPLIIDLNNDGLQDIVITYVNDKHRVYKNLGDATFLDVTETANLGGQNLVGGPATVADFDNDGLLDIYITYFGHYTKGVLPTLKRRNDNGLPNQLFKNMGNFNFKNITKGSGVDNSGWTQAVAHTDFNSDGLQDIIVGNDFGVNAYYKNLGMGKFTNVAAELGTDKPSYTMNIGIADLNQDQRPDIYISNIVTMNKDEKYVLPNEYTTMKFNAEKLSTMRVIEANDLFLSTTSKNNELSYELSKAVGRGYSSTGWSWDADFFDYDNDGDNDLYVLNGMNEFNLYSSENPYYTDPLTNKKENVYIPVSTKESNVFFVNEGGKLINQSKDSGVNLIGNSRSATYLDFDKDGDLDIAINNYHEASFFYKNNLMKESNHWVSIKLEGDVSKNVNRDAIGAKIILTTTDGQKVWREIHSTSGYMSVHPKIQYFGLGQAEILTIKIIWPNNQEQIMTSLEMNKEHIIKQSNYNKSSKHKKNIVATDS